MQSYLTMRWLADPEYRDDAFGFYAYFRWLDDMVDEHLPDAAQRLAFVARQRELLAAASAGARTGDVSPEEALLVRLVGPARHAGARPSGTDGTTGGALTAVTAMLDVMEFDARRRGRAVSQDALDRYTHVLAVAVTESLHHCIGHGEASPHDESRYVAVTGAHVAHMLRDLAEDLAVGYINVPAELAPHPMASLHHLHDPARRAWVRDRVEYARACFATGREYLAHVQNRRCRLAGHLYIARFEWVLDVVERDGYRLRPSYPERATIRGGLWVAAHGARSALVGPDPGRPPRRTLSSAPR